MCTRRHWHRKHRKDRGTKAQEHRDTRKHRPKNLETGLDTGTRETQTQEPRDGKVQGEGRT